MALANLQDTAPATLRAALDSVFASRAYRWTDTPALLRLWHEWLDRLHDWLHGLRAGNPIVFRLVVIAILIVLGLVLAHAAWVVWQTVRRGEEPDAGAGRTIERDTRDAAWYLREADRAAASGRTAEAVQLAFVGLALTLEGQGLLRYQPSKTPAECAREARLAREDRERLGELVRTLYAHAFGGGPLGPDGYRRWREELARPWHAPAH